jgi:hypothetical protein
MHDERVRQVDRSIFPRRKRRGYAVGVGGSQRDSERTRLPSAARPSPEELRPLYAFALGFSSVTNPQQLKHCVDKGETPICRALSRMLVRRTFLQSEPNKVLRLGCPNRGADEQMVQLNLHASKSKASASSGASTSSRQLGLEPFDLKSRQSGYRYEL